MSTKNVTLHDENGNVLLPATKTSRVTNASGTDLDTLLQQAGQVKSISVNGVAQTIDTNGNVNITSADGVGIASVVQTTTSTEDGGTNVITVTKTDNTTSTFSVKNGSKGSKGDQGIQGERGLPGESGVTGDVSGFTVHQTINSSTTYGATDIAGAASLQATNQELTELGGELYEAIEDGYTESKTVDVLTEYDVSSMLATRLYFRSNVFTDTTAASSLLLPYVEDAKIVTVTSSIEFRTNELKDIPKSVTKPYKKLAATWVAGADYGKGTRTFTLNAQTERMQLQFKSIDAETIISGTTSIKIYCENYRKLLKDADIVNNITDGGTDKVLSAEQGKVLNEKIDNEIDTLSTDINDKLNDLTSQVEHLNEAWFDVDEDGLYFVDKYQNIGAKFDSNGFHAININE